MDGSLLLRCQGENRPVASVVLGALQIRVERDLDLHHADIVRRSRTGLASPFQHLWQYRFSIELARLTAGADQAIAHSASIFRDQCAGGGDIDRDGYRGAIVNSGVLGAIILTFERYSLLGPEPTHQGDGLTKTREPLLEIGPGDAGRRNLVQRFPGADAKHDPTGKHDPKSGDGLRHHRGVIAKGGREDTRADGDPRRKRPEGAEPCQRERSMAAVMFPWLEMVAD